MLPLEAINRVRVLSERGIEFATESKSIGLMLPSEGTSSQQETSADAIATAAGGGASPTTDTTPSSGENV